MPVEQREKIRQTMKLRRLSKEHRRRIGAANRGRVVSDETREKVRQANLGNPLLVGRKHSAETRARMSERRRRLWQQPDYRAKMNKILHSYSPERREKHRRARMRQQLPARDTSLERILSDEFKKRRLGFEMHKSMFGRFQPDFVFADVRLVVQADGDYWHRIKPGAKEKDARFNATAHAQGWTVWRFAESEIRQYPQACGRAVARFVRSH